jgi:hypothetical protein
MIDHLPNRLGAESDENMTWVAPPRTGVTLVHHDQEEHMAGRDPEQSESDVQADDHVASTRASSDDDGDYVGRTFADDDFDAGESGAEARAKTE